MPIPRPELKVLRGMYIQVTYVSFAVFQRVQCCAGIGLLPAPRDGLDNGCHEDKLQFERSPSTSRRDSDPTLRKVF